jgi:hypothetical protein
MDHQLSSDLELCSIPPRFKRTAQAIFVIPAKLRTELLPPNTLSLKALTDFALPLQAQQCQSTKAHSIPNFFSQNAPLEQTSSSLSILRHLTTADVTTIQQLVNHGQQAWLDSFRSIHFAHLSDSLTSSENISYFPLWVITYWQNVVDVKQTRSHWIKSCDWITTQIKQKKSAERQHLAEMANILLLSLPWGVAKPPGSSAGNDPIHMLWRYLGPNWLTCSEQNDLLKLLREEIFRMPAVCFKFSVQNTYFTTLLLDAFNSRASDYDSNKRFSWIRELGDGLSTEGSVILTIVHLGEITNNPHWVPLVIEKDAISYGDSFKMEMPEKLKSACVWWLQCHVPFSQPVIKDLSITVQTDGHSCGILTDNALHHFVSPVDNPFVGAAPSDLIAQQLKLFNIIAQNITKRVRSPRWQLSAF